MSCMFLMPIPHAKLAQGMDIAFPRFTKSVTLTRKRQGGSWLARNSETARAWRPQSIRASARLTELADFLKELLQGKQLRTMWEGFLRRCLARVHKSLQLSTYAWLHAMPSILLHY